MQVTTNFAAYNKQSCRSRTPPGRPIVLETRTVSAVQQWNRGYQAGGVFGVMATVRVTRPKTRFIITIYPINKPILETVMPALWTVSWSYAHSAFACKIVMWFRLSHEAHDTCRYLLDGQKSQVVNRWCYDLLDATTCCYVAWSTNWSTTGVSRTSNVFSVLRFS